MSTSTLVRLDQLEVAFGGGGKCVTCYNHPVRIVTLNEDTDELVTESMPVEGCPSCGRNPMVTIQIIVTDDGEAE